MENDSVFYFVFMSADCVLLLKIRKNILLVGKSNRYTGMSYKSFAVLIEFE